MKCPTCNARLYVVDSRTQKRGAETRRRYECKTCGERWSSHERIDPPKLARPPARVVRVHELWELP